jgi:hypothetical protein
MWEQHMQIQLILQPTIRETYEEDSMVIVSDGYAC